MADDDSAPATPFAHLKTILVAIDGSDYSNYGLQVAADLSRASKARVIAVHVRHLANEAVEIAASGGAVAGLDEIYNAADEVAEQARASATKVLGNGDFEGWTYEERSGATVDSIVEAVKEHTPDVVVVGAKGHNALYDLLVGSIAQGVVKHATASVLVARKPEA
ncbi:MAG: universal stress protein [Candidatus Dormiibacterota bacterium]